MDYIYSKQLKKYISLHPLVINSRTVKAAHKIGITLNWNDSGHINNLTYIQTKELLHELGSGFLSIEDYVVLLNEVKDTMPQHYHALVSKNYAEWLDDVYYKEKQNIKRIAHPNISDDKVEETEIKVSPINEGRPGWFSESAFEDNVYPDKLSKNYTDVDSNDPIWKYWSPHREHQWVAGIRGYVVSSDTFSLDLDIPLTAHQPSLLIREVRDDIHTVDPGEKFIKNHERLLGILESVKPPFNEKKAESSQREEIGNLLSQQLEKLRDFEPKDQKHFRETYIDLVGSLSVFYPDNPTFSSGQFDGLLDKQVPSDRKLTLSGLLDYLKSSKNLLEGALKNKKDVVFVIGHENPDADAIVGSMLEAYHLQFYDERVVVPVVYGSHIPSEVKKLFDVDLSNYFIFADSDLYKKSSGSGLARWVLVDTHYHDKPKFIDGIVDHHIVPEKFVKRRDIYCSSELAWTSILQVTYKYIGMGLKPDKFLARLIIQSTTLEADLLSLQENMNEKDKHLWSYLLALAEVDDDYVRSSYKELMSEFLSIDVIEELFWRDYKQDLGNFGIAVIKIKQESFKEEYEVISKRIKALTKHAFEKQNLATVIVSLACYDEEYNFTQGSFNVYLGTDRKDTVRSKLIKYIKDYISKYFADNVQQKVTITDLGLDYFSVPFQVPRLLLGPGLANIVMRLDRFFYSPSQKLYVSRDLATKKDISSNESNKFLTNVNYREVKKIIYTTKYRLLSATEYFHVLADAKLVKDHDMANALTSKHYTEYLDTVILNTEELIHHPTIDSSNGDSFKGEVLLHETPYVHPGLIKLDDIDKVTGLPKIVQGPDTYDDEDLWRFWSADDYPAIAVRSYIFLLLQPSLDLKMNVDDRHSNLGFRLVYAETNS